MMNYSIYWVDSKVDANVMPPTVSAYIKVPLPGHSKMNPGLETLTIEIRIDKMLRRVMKEFEILRRRWMCGQISDVTINLLFLGLYGSLRSIYRHRSKITRALRQLKRDSKIRKYIVWRLIRARNKYRGKNVNRWW